jgi:O-antigen/teichoic acid export membrane protein
MFSWVFGNEWAMAGFYTQILALYTFFWFMSGPISTVFAVTDTQDKVLHIQVILFVLKGLGLVIGGWMGSPIGAMIGLSISGVLGYGYLMFVIAQLTGLKATFFWKEFRFQLLPVVVFGIGYLFVQTLPVFFLLGYAVVACLGYYFYLFTKEPEMKQLLSNLNS